MRTSLGYGLLAGLIGLIMAAATLLVLTCVHLASEGLPTPSAVPPPPQTATSKSLPTPRPSLTATATPSPSTTPSPSPSPSPTPTPLPPVVGYVVHIVRAGEELEAIARQYRSDTAQIALLNRFPPREPLGDGRPLVIPLYAGHNLTGTLPAGGFEVSRGLPGRRVALTFDAGASAAPAPAILDTLQAYDVRITFFLTGRWAEDNPDLVRRMAAEGHEFGNHTYDHPRLTELDEAGIRDQVERTEEIIRNLTAQSTRPFLRPPYGSRNQYVVDTLAGLGYISIYWTVDSLDSVGEPKTPEFLLQRVTHPTDWQGNPIPLEGAILLMHIGSQPSAEALPAILEWFQQEGYQVVKLSEILRVPQR